MKIMEIIANNWVSWLIELVIMLLVASFMIAEVKEVGDQAVTEVKQISTQIGQVVDKFDKNVSGYAKEKAEKIDEATSAGKEKASDIFNTLLKKTGP